MFLKRQARFVLLVAFVLLPAASSREADNRDLTRKLVGELISQQLALPKRGKGIEFYAAGSVCAEQSTKFWPFSAAEYQLLQSIGWIKIGPAYRCSLWGCVREIQFTSEGLKHLQQLEELGKLPRAAAACLLHSEKLATNYSIPLVSPQLLEVTGISVVPGLDPQAFKQALYTWKWVSSNHTGVKQLDRPPPDSQIHQGHAAFQLYDDGWRLADLDL